MGRRWSQVGPVYLALLALSLLAMRLQVVPPAALGSATAPISELGLRAADNLRRVGRTFSAERQSAAELEHLRRQTAQLAQQNEQLQLEVQRLRQMLKVTRTQAPNALGVAQVIAVDPSPLLARLTLDKGSAEGLRPHLPVTVPEGLVGQVVRVGVHRSQVLALVDPESSVGVTLKGGRGGRGLAVGLAPDRLRAEFAAGTPLKVGDELVTSSLGGVYPVGIRVGTVEKVLPPGPNDLRRAVIVKPAVEVGTVDDVTVLGGL